MSTKNYSPYFTRSCTPEYEGWMEEKRGQDDGSDGGVEEGEVRVGALGGAPGEAVWAGGYFIIVGFFVLFLLL